jgi:hypothetical protein
MHYSLRRAVPERERCTVFFYIKISWGKLASVTPDIGRYICRVLRPVEQEEYARKLCT